MNTDFSARLKSIRSAKGITQKDLAVLLGVGQTTVANYERGIRLPDSDKLSKIASLFGVTIDYLLGRDEIITHNTGDDSVRSGISSQEDSLRLLMKLLLGGDIKSAKELLRNLQKSGVTIRELYFQILGEAMKEVGVLWEKGSLDIWKEHYISETVMDLMRELKDREKKNSTSPHRLLALTPGPELHSIGLRMITDILELEGWDITYIGTNVPAQSIIKAVEEKNPHIIAFSVTMPSHIDSARNTILAIKNHFGNHAPKIIVGGTAFINSSDVCAETGADYYGVSLEDIEKIAETKTL